MDAFLAVTALAVGATAAGAWASWRRTARRWEHTVGRLGLAVTAGGGMEGAHDGRKVLLTRLPGLESTLTLQLTTAWDVSWIATRDGCSQPLTKLFARYPELRSVVLETLGGQSGAEVRGGALVLRSRDWPETDEALAAWLRQGAAAASRVERAAGEVAAAERARLRQWRESLVRAGLRIAGPDRIEGSMRDCELELTRTARGTRVRAWLGPDLPAGLGVRQGDASEIVVESEQPARTDRLLGHPEVRSALRQLMDTLPGTAISEGTLVCEVPVWDESIDELERALRAICDLIQQVQRHTD